MDVKSVYEVRWQRKAHLETDMIAHILLFYRCCIGPASFTGETVASSLIRGRSLQQEENRIAAV